MVTSTESPDAAVEPIPGVSYMACGFARHEKAVPACRRWLQAFLDEEKLNVPDAAVIIDELAANVVRHACEGLDLWRFGFVARCYYPLDGCIRLEIRDKDPKLPVIQEQNFDGESGRGLLMVDALALEWGFVPESDGKVVYAVLAVLDVT